MKILVLAAGYGTRLYPLVKNTPKPLLEVNKKPIINYILAKFKDNKRLSEVFVVTNNKFYENFLEWAEKESSFPAKITIVNDGTETPEDRLGSIGDINFVLESAEVDDDLLVVGGDNIFDFNLDEYCKFAEERSPNISIGTYDIGKDEDATKFGVVELNDKGKVVSFEEKPNNPKSSLISMCFYYMPKKSLGLVGQYLIESQKSDKAGDYIRWLCQNNTVFGFKFEGKWYDIGSIEAYDQAQKEFSK